MKTNKKTKGRKKQTKVAGKSETDPGWEYVVTRTYGDFPSADEIFRAAEAKDSGSKKQNPRRIGFNT